ncbi:class I SAM-dependent methyltransferase [Neobacillus muris]|uniref:class I SAM-dependent methyltransferase n=1 Tax=Neobacillus muris TaxID=2941334 RepID=UPI00203C85B1|nr:class I SAM-dependent methyltransferase [Neobacillus muris]
MDTKRKWNQKHKERVNHQEVPEPNARLKDLSAYLSGGTAIDLACGLGGNSIFLARLNYQIQAVDISDVAIKYVKEQADLLDLAINPQVFDLTEGDHLPLKASSFDLAVMTYYLDRSLFLPVKNSIKQNGYFFMETFFQSQQKEEQGVSNQYKLKPQELLSEFGDWKVLFYEENEQEGRQTIFCQKVSG